MSTFNWQTMNRSDFMYWAFLHMYERDKMAEMSAATNKFTEVEITMQINGVEIEDATAWMRAYEQQIQRMIRGAAGEMVRERLDQLDRIAEKLQDSVHLASDSILDAVKAEGIAIRSEDW